jgi:hypothetical protein
MPTTDAVPPLILFMALVLASSLHGLAVSGHFPAQHRSPTLKSGAGRLLLRGTIAIAVAAVLAGIAAAWQAIPWPAAVIGGGAMVLSAPPVLRLFPGSFVDGRGALLTFAGAAASFALLMIWIALAGGRWT